MKTGRLYWITGLSGAGKTSLSQCLYRRLKFKKDHVILLDGDKLRSIYDLPGHYDFAGRKEMSMRHARICHMLTKQNMDVICATISMFDEVRTWLSNEIEEYTEIFIDVKDEILDQRRKKATNAKPHSKDHMVGKGVDAELPKSPHITLVNNGYLTIPELCSQLEFLLIRSNIKSQES